MLALFVIIIKVAILNGPLIFLLTHYDWVSKINRVGLLGHSLLLFWFWRVLAVGVVLGHHLLLQKLLHRLLVRLLGLVLNLSVWAITNSSHIHGLIIIRKNNLATCLLLSLLLLIIFISGEHADPVTSRTLRVLDLTTGSYWHSYSFSRSHAIDIMNDWNLIIRWSHHIVASICEIEDMTGIWSDISFGYFVSLLRFYWALLLSLGSLWASGHVELCWATILLLETLWNLSLILEKHRSCRNTWYTRGSRHR